MNKKILSIISLILVLCMFTCTLLTSCGEPEEEAKEPHTHTYASGDSWTHDATMHWHAATCDTEDDCATARIDLAGHTDDDHDAACDVCSYAPDHTHTYDDEWVYDNKSHWNKSDCYHAVIGNKGDHTPDMMGVCTVCGYEVSEPTVSTVADALKVGAASQDSVKIGNLVMASGNSTSYGTDKEVAYEYRDGYLYVNDGGSEIYVTPNGEDEVLYVETWYDFYGDYQMIVNPDKTVYNLLGPEVYGGYNAYSFTCYGAVDLLETLYDIGSVDNANADFREEIIEIEEYTVYTFGFGYYVDGSLHVINAMFSLSDEYYIDNVYVSSIRYGENEIIEIEAEEAGEPSTYVPVDVLFEALEKVSGNDGEIAGEYVIAIDGITVYAITIAADGTLTIVDNTVGGALSGEYACAYDEETGIITVSDDDDGEVVDALEVYYDAETAEIYATVNSDLYSYDIGFTQATGIENPFDPDDVVMDDFLLVDGEGDLVKDDTLYVYSKTYNYFTFENIDPETANMFLNTISFSGDLVNLSWGEDNYATAINAYYTVGDYYFSLYAKGPVGTEYEIVMTVNGVEHTYTVIVLEPVPSEVTAGTVSSVWGNNSVSETDSVTITEGDSVILAAHFDVNSAMSVTVAPEVDLSDYAYSDTIWSDAAGAYLPLVGYNLAGLPAGTYTVTFTSTVDETVTTSVEVVVNADEGGGNEGGDAPALEGSGTSDDPYVITDLGTFTASVPEYGTVYYTYTASADATVVLSSTHSDFYIGYSTFNFNLCDTLTPSWGATSATVTLTAGATLYIKVETYSGAATDVDFTLADPNTTPENPGDGDEVTYDGTLTVNDNYGDTVSGEYDYVDNGDGTYVIYLNGEVTEVIALGYDASTETYYLTVPYFSMMPMALGKLGDTYYDTATYYNFSVVITENENAGGNEGGEDDAPALEGSGTADAPYVITDLGNFTASVPDNFGTVYYTFTPSSDVTVVLSSTHSDFYIGYSTFGFDFCDTLTPSWGATSATVTVTAGATLYIKVETYSGEAAEVDFTLADANAAEDDAPALSGSGTADDPYVITDLGNFTASVPDNFGTVYYTFTPSSDVTVVLSSTHSDFYIGYSTFGFDFCDTITPSWGAISATVTVTAGATLYIKVETYSGEAAEVNFTLANADAAGDEEDEIVYDGTLTVEDYNDEANGVTGEYDYVINDDGTYTIYQNGEVTTAIAFGYDASTDTYYLTAAYYSAMPMALGLMGDTYYDTATYYNFRVVITENEADGGEDDAPAYEGSGTESDPYVLPSLPSELTINSDISNQEYFVFTAEKSGTLTITYPNSDSWVSVFELDENGNTTQNSDSTYLTESFTFEVTEGNTYRIGLSTWNNAGEYTITLEIV